MIQSSITINEIAVTLFIRLFLGVLFFFQGYDKVFNMGVNNVIETIHTPLKSKGISNIISTMGAYFTSYVELICGGLLIIGFATHYCLYLLGIDILFVAFVFGIVEPLWDMKHIFPRLILIVILLLIPSSWDRISADYIWSLIKSTY